MMKRRSTLKQLKERISKIELPNKTAVYTINEAIKPMLTLPETTDSSSKYKVPRIQIPNANLLLPLQIMPLEQQPWSSKKKNQFLMPNNQAVEERKNSREQPSIIEEDFSGIVESATSAGVVAKEELFNKVILKMEDPMVTCYLIIRR
jgi:hypothetical protein